MTAPEARQRQKRRIRTVEHESGWGWIARNPWTGEEVIQDFRWRTRRVARTVVDEARLIREACPAGRAALDTERSE